jgi:hypothetical protein
VSSPHFYISDADSCQGTDDLGRDGLHLPNGDLVTPYPRHPGPPPPPWIAHAHLDQWKDRREPDR